jgi:hypothetical protein
MNAILATVRGFLRKGLTESFLLVLGIAVAVFMGATVTGSISAYAAYMEKEASDPRFGEVVVSPAVFRDSQSEAATKMDADRKGSGASLSTQMRPRRRWTRRRPWMPPTYQNENT